MSKQASSGAELRHLLPWACYDLCSATGRESWDFHYTLFTSHTISSPREEPQLCRFIISSSETTDTDRKCQDRSGGHTEWHSVPLGMFPGSSGFDTEKQLPFGRSRSVGTQTAWRILGVLWGLAAPSPVPAVHVLGLRADPDQEPRGTAQRGVP